MHGSRRSKARARLGRQPGRRRGVGEGDPRSVRVPLGALASLRTYPRVLRWREMVRQEAGARHERSNCLDCQGVLVCEAIDTSWDCQGV